MDDDRFSVFLTWGLKQEVPQQKWNNRLSDKNKKLGEEKKFGGTGGKN